MVLLQAAIEVLSDDGNDHEQTVDNDHSRFIRNDNSNPTNRENDEIRVSTDHPLGQCNESRSPTTDPSANNKISNNSEDMQHLIDRLIQYPATMEDSIPSDHHHHHHHHHHHNGQSMIISDQNDNDNDNDGDNDDLNRNDNNDNYDGESLTLLPMPGYERSYRIHILRPIHALAKQQDQIAGERHAEIIMGDVRRRLNPVFRALYNSAWRCYSPLSSRQNNGDSSDVGINAHPSVSPAWNVPGIPPSNPNDDVDDEPFVLLDQPGAVFVDTEAEALTKTKLLPQTIRALLKLGTMLKEKSYLGGSSEDVVACIFLDFVGMICAVLKLGGCIDSDGSYDDDCNDDDSVVVVDVKMESIHNGEEETKSNLKRQKTMPTTDTDGPDILKGTDKNNDTVLPNLLEYIGNNLLSVTARILTQEACHFGYIQSLFLMRTCKTDGKKPVDEAVRNYTPAFYRTYSVFDSEGDREEIDEEETDYLSPLRSGEWRDYYALYHPEHNNKISSSQAACVVVDCERESVGWQVSRHLIAVARYFVQGKGLESLIDLVASGITEDCDENMKGNVLDKLPRGRKRLHDQSRRMARACVASVYPTLEIFRSIAFLSRFYCSNSAENDGSDNDCLSPLNLRRTLEAFRSTVSQFIESLQIGIHIVTADDRQTILNILSSIERRSMTEEEWQNTSNISTGNSLTTTVEKYRNKSFTIAAPTVGIVPFVDFTFSESSKLKMATLWKFLTGHDGHGKGNSMGAAVVPSLQCQIQGLNELISWLNSLESDVREYEAQYELDSKKELETPILENDGRTDNLTDNLESKKGGDGVKSSAVEVIEVEVTGVNLATSHMPEVSKRSKACGASHDYTEPQGGEDDIESTEVCCNSNSSLQSVENCPELSSFSVEGSAGACCIKSSGSMIKDDGKMEHEGNKRLCEETEFQSRHQQETIGTNVSPINDAKSYKIVDLLQKRLLTLLSRLRSADYPILEHIFSSNGLHSELLKRTLPLLIFFTRHRQLHKNDIKLMWDASRFGSCPKGLEITDSGIQAGTFQLHESVRSAIFDLILGLINISESWILLGVEIFSYLASLFTQVEDCNWWTSQSLGIVESVVHHSIDSIIGNIYLGNTDDECVVPAGFEVLWSLSQDSSANEPSPEHKEITNTAFPILMRVVERVLTIVRDEFALSSKKFENFKAEYGNGINCFVYKASVDPSIKSPNKLAIRLAMQRLQTYLIRRSVTAIDVRDGLSCPTSTIRIMLSVMNFIPLQVENAESESSIDAENSMPLLLSIENIFQQYDLGAVLIKEMIHFANFARVDSNSKCLSESRKCAHYLIENSQNDEQFYSLSECVSFRLKLFRLTFTRFVQLHFLTLQNILAHTNGVIPIEDVSTKKRKRELSTQRLCENTCNDIGRISKRPILISTEDYEDDDLTSYNTERSQIEPDQVSKERQASSPKNQFLDSSKFHPTPSEISKIWSSLVSNSLSNKTMDHTFDLLYCLLSQDFGHSVELGQWREDIARTIYPLCCSLDPPNISKAGYKLLIYCLGFTNVAKGNFVLVAGTQEQNDSRELSNILLGLSHGQESKQIYTPCFLLSESESYTVDICSYQLCGLNILWLIILEGRDENVADMCMIYMAVLNAYTNTNSSQQMSFVKQCMAELNNEGADNNIIMKKKRMLRLIRLYTEYTIHSSRLKAPLRHSGISHGHQTFQGMSELYTEEVVGSNLPYNIYIDILDGPRFKVYCSCGISSTVAFVRKSIWHHLTNERWPGDRIGTNGDKSRYDGKEFRLIFNGSELRDDMAKIGTLQIFENNTVYCCPRMCTENIKKKAATHVIESARKKEKKKKKRVGGSTFRSKESCGITTLVSPSCINSFFSLFLPKVCDDPEDRKRLRALVWDLLQLLPTEPQLRKSFQCIGNHHQTSCAPITWEKWLPTPKEGQSTAPYRLLYGLQLIESFALHYEDRQININSDNVSPKSLSSPERYSEDGTSSDDDVIIVKDPKSNLKNHEADNKNPKKKRAYIVMDDDDDFVPSKKHFNVVEENDNLIPPINDAENTNSFGDPNWWCKNFVSLGGLRHLVHLFTSIDLSLLSLFVDSENNTKQANGYFEKRQHANYHGEAVGTFSILMACVNKALFLIKIISTRATDNHGGALIERHLCNKQDTSIESERVQFLKHLFKMIHWAVDFQIINDETSTQLNSSNLVANHSTFLESKGLSSVEVGASVAIQCLFLVRMLSQATEQGYDKMSQRKYLILNYCDVTTKSDVTVHSATLLDAMASSIVKSPAPHVRSLALSVFRSLLCLQEPNRKRTTVETKTNDNCGGRLKSLALSVLISLLPIGRGKDPEGKTHFDIISRTSVLFDMVVYCLSDIWSHTCAEAQQDAIDYFVGYFQRDWSVISPRDLPESSSAPTIAGVRDFGPFFVWLVKEVNSLDPREYRTYFPVGELEGKHCDIGIKIMVDSYLVGLLSLMHKVIQVTNSSDIKALIGCIKVSETKMFLHLLFDKCAFLKPQGKNHNKASSFFVSPQARDRSLDLMRTLCTDCRPNIVRLLKIISDKFYTGPPRQDLMDDWNVDLSSKQKSVTGHVGMKNQGATCYMNSLLQQFFHTPALREGLLSCDLQNSVAKSVDSGSTGEGYKLLHELQLLFGNLLLSEKRDFDTSELVKSIRGYDGNPIRPAEQQDVDEFFNLFCDRLENALKPFPQRRLLHNVFGGQLSHLITCQKCNYSSERVEDFLSISLDVKGKKNILESLDLYIQGEVLDGSNKYFCSCCKAKRESIKRCCIKTLPNVLICHLKRFEFDLEMLRKVKVNDRCEFPLELNMKKYTKESINCTTDSDEFLSWRTNKYYQYNLRGVLVHAGTADSGHYYSLAQVRKKEAAHQAASNDQWYCFNDSNVTPFDSAKLEATTFGGSLLTQNPNLRSDERDKINLAKSYSAYLLIYDREENYTFDDQVNCNPDAVPVGLVEKDCDHDNPSVGKPEWRERIIRENNGYIRDLTLFAPAYSYFLIDLTKMSTKFMDENEKSSILPNLEAIQLLTCHWLENLVHAKDRSYEVEKMIAILSVWYESSLVACSWLLNKFLTTHQIWVEKILLHCRVLETRCAFVKLLSIIFQRMAPTERTAYFFEIDTSLEEKDNFEPSCNFDSDDYMIVRQRGNQSKESISRLGRMKYWKSKSILARFVGICLLDKLEGCDVYWRTFDQLFESILAFSCCGHEEACFLIRCGIVLRLVDIYLEQNSVVLQKSLVRSPFLQFNGTNRNCKSQMGDKYKKPNFFPLLKLLCNLVCSAMVVPDDDDVSDSDSDSEPDTRGLCNNLTNDLENSYLTMFAHKKFTDTNLTYELPQRDGWQVSRPDLFEKMLDEPVPPPRLESHMLSCSPSNGKRPRTPPSDLLNDVINLICTITCHVCCDNFELSLRICSFAKTLLEERKADEFHYALNVLLSMLHIQDKHFKERIPCASSAIITGIQKNSAYEKETVHLIQILQTELRKMRTSDYGTEGQAICHGHILHKLDDIILPLIPGENSTFAVKQSVVSLLRSFLPLPQDSLSQYMDDASFVGYQNKPNCDDSQPDSKGMKPLVGIQTKRVYERDQNGGNDGLSTPPYRKTYSHGSREDKKESKDNLRPLTHYFNEEDIKDKIFSSLIRIFDIICETVATQSTRTACSKTGGITVQGRNSHSSDFEGFTVDSTAFSEYFEALRICLSGAKVQERICNDNDWVFEVCDVLFQLLWKIDDEGRSEKRPSADNTKGEIILLIEFLLQLNPNQCVRALQKDTRDSATSSSLKHKKDTKSIVHDNRTVNADPTTKMLEMYVTNLASNADYNDRYMANYYSILLRLAKHNTEFCHAMLSHENWRWALKSFVLSHMRADSGKLYSVILNGTLNYVSKNIKFREVIFRQLLKRDGKDAIETASIQLLLAIFNDESTSCSSMEGTDKATMNCISHFVQGSCGGMSKLSLAFKNAFTELQEADSKQTPPDITVLESLSICLRCMCLILNSFGINKVREIMQDCWPEVDDVNFMLTQIKTRTDKEWEQSYKVRTDAKVTVMQIITQASEVLTILASVEAAAQAVAE